MKILVMRLSSLGDVVLTQPVVKALVDAGHEVDFLTKPAFTGLVESFAVPVGVIAYTGVIPSLRIIKQERYDLLIDLHKKTATILLRLIAGKKSVSYNKRSILRRRLVRGKKLPGINSVVDLYCGVLPALGLPATQPQPSMQPKPEVVDRIRPFWANEGLWGDKINVAIFPGGSAFTKRWPVNRWQELIMNTPDSWGCRFLLMGDVKDKAAAQEICRGNNARDLCGIWNPEELIAALSFCQVVLSNDSGPMHIAAALGLPQAAIFGATHPMLGFAPQNPKAVVLQSNQPCRPCSLHGGPECPRGHLRCLKDITVDLMRRTLQFLLEEYIWQVN